MDCVECGTPNISAARYCSRCGSSFDEDPVFGASGSAMLSWRDIEAETAGRADPTLGSDSAWQRTWSPASGAAALDARRQEALYAVVIGQNNPHHYLERFTRFDTRGRTSMGWHWPAFFATFCWMVYRKMWLGALLYLALPAFAALALMAAIGRSHHELVGLGFGLYLLLIFLLPPLLADGWYYRSCRRRIDAALVAGKNSADQRQRLTRRGGTTNASVVTLCLLLPPAVMAGLAALMAIAYP